MSDNRGSFTSRIGFVLAAAGSAVGLGNIWRFPYLAAKNGGGIFLLIYIILVLTVGIALMTAEITIGRKTGLSVCSAFKKLNKKWAFVGVLGAIVPAIILPYYSVIGGWVLKYLVAFCEGFGAETAEDGFFGGFISSSASPLFWYIIFIGLVTIIIVYGVQKGIERASKILMPLLVILTIIVAIYSIFLPGAGAGLVYYLKPDFANLSWSGVLNAMSQMFYSLSLAMGIMITYGSYVQKKENIETAVTHIALFDTAIAFLAGLMIIPAVFSFMGPEALNAGPGLMFITLPKVFNSMTGGGFIGAVFFILVFFAALTSAISLMEAVVASFQDEFNFSRTKAIIATLIICVVLGVPSSMGNGAWSSFLIMGMDFLSFCDYISNNIMMPVVAVLTCVFVGYVIKPQAIVEEVELSNTFKKKKLFELSIKFFAPVCIFIILVSQFV
ncbi:MAG: sodium-dependent transporter [Spirochaetia bacterium]|nr:sodium-dependent transporter [Spirochaetia bacterium]